MARRYQKKEDRLVQEWLSKFHPGQLQWKRVRVGPLPKGKEQKIFGILRRWADIVFKEGNTIFIVEAKMRPDPGAIGQLLHYLNLLPQTPEFSEWKDLDRKGVFLTTTRDPEVEKLAKEHNIDYVVFMPSWAKTYIEEKLLGPRR